MTTQTMVDELSALDNAHVLHPHSMIGRPVPPLIFSRGEGARLWDVTGKEYVDGTCGLWQCAVGHGRPELAEIAAAQIKDLEFYPSFWDMSNEPAIRLAARLASIAPDGLSTTFFTNGGSEGIETAVKLVRLACWAKGEPERTVILSRKGGYHGMGSASLAATGIPALKQGFGPLAPDFVHLTSPHAAAVGPNATEVLAAELGQVIEKIGAHRIAGFIGEPVLGVGGMIPPPEGYWERVQEILRRNGIMLVADEVVTAYGRIGSWFGSDRYHLDPDIIVTAKALTSGYLPMGAVLIHDRVMAVLDGQQFRHGFTYNGHPVCAAVALANLDIIEREGLMPRALQMGERMLKGLESLSDCAAVAEVRGVGLMLGVELDGVDAAKVSTGAREAGVIVRATGQKIVMSPPLVVNEDQVDRIVQVVTDEVRKL